MDLINGYNKGNFDNNYVLLSGYGLKALSDFLMKISSTDNAIVRFDGTSGSILNSGVIIDDNNNITATKFITTNGTSSLVVLGTGDLQSSKTLPLYEAYLEWGGHNFSGSYGPIDAAMVPDLGANRFLFLKASGITVEYSTDGGSTWQDYGLSNALKISLFSTSLSVVCGKHSSGTAINSNYQARVTVSSSQAEIYTTLNKFVVYISTSGSTGCWCTITGRIQTDYENNNDTWTTFANKVSISGWSGYNVINTAPFTAYGNSDAKSSLYGQIRFTFGYTGGSTTTYQGLTIVNIKAFGGVGWTTPSLMAKTGHLYNFDYNQNATFPANITASSFIKSGGTSSQFLKADGSIDTNAYLPLTGGTLNRGENPKPLILETTNTSTNTGVQLTFAKNGTELGGLGFDVANTPLFINTSGTKYELLHTNNLPLKKGSGNYSVLQTGSTASGDYSHAEGKGTTASSEVSHAEGVDTEASGNFSHAEGLASEAKGNTSHAEGESTISSGDFSHSEGDSTTASGESSHAEGSGNTSSGDYSHTEGNGTTASGSSSHAEGYLTTALGQYSHAEGSSTSVVSDTITSSTSYNDIMTAWNSNKFSLALKDSSHVEGKDNLALADCSHAEGFRTEASGNYSHAEGFHTEASGSYSHAECFRTEASGDCSHAEGFRTEASGDYSHAEGGGTKASGVYSHAEGLNTTAHNLYEHAEGKYNYSNGLTLHSIGIGDLNTRKNAFEITSDGNIFMYELNAYNGSNSYQSSRSIQTYLNPALVPFSVNDWNLIFNIQVTGDYYLACLYIDDFPDDIIDDILSNAGYSTLTEYIQSVTSNDITNSNYGTNYVMPTCSSIEYEETAYRVYALYTSNNNPILLHENMLLASNKTTGDLNGQSMEEDISNRYNPFSFVLNNSFETQEYDQAKLDSQYWLIKTIQIPHITNPINNSHSETITTIYMENYSNYSIYAQMKLCNVEDFNDYITIVKAKNGSSDYGKIFEKSGETFTYKGVTYDIWLDVYLSEMYGGLLPQNVKYSDIYPHTIEADSRNIYTTYCPFVATITYNDGVEIYLNENRAHPYTTVLCIE